MVKAPIWAVKDLDPGRKRINSFWLAGVCTNQMMHGSSLSLGSLSGRERAWEIQSAHALSARKEVALATPETRKWKETITH